MLGEISRTNTSEAQLPAEFEALRKENQALLDKVKNEVAEQERYTEEIERLHRANTRLEKLVMESKDTDAAAEWVHSELFKNNITALTANERGQFYLDGKLIPYPTLIKAFAAPPDDDPNGKSIPRWLKVTLPAGAKPTDAVFHFRLKQLAAAADQMGIRHSLFPE
jgi:protoporphyrinogen oxidase